MNNNASRFEAMAMQSLLPGLTFAVERAVELLNRTRAVLSLPPVIVVSPEQSAPARRGRRPRAAQIEDEPVESEAEEAAPVKASRKRWTPKQRREIGQRTRDRWAAMREAGITPRKNSPSSAEVQRALKIIERRTRKTTAKAA